MHGKTGSLNTRRIGRVLKAFVIAGLWGIAPRSANSGIIEYHYDTLGRLIQSCNAQSGSGVWTNAALDPADNRQNYSTTRVDVALTENSGIFSENGKFMLWMQPDGNLVAYGNFGSGWTPLGWATNTVGSGATEAYFQSDGNLVLYTSSGTSVWASHTDVNRCASISVHDDGNVVITSSTGALLWQTNTGGH